MPFSEVCCRVTGLFQDAREIGRRRIQEIRGTVLIVDLLDIESAVDSVASGKIRCQEDGTAWGTYREFT
jgi:hypothetical protein